MTTTDPNEFRNAVKGLLESKKIRTFIGWEQGSNAFRSRPLFLRSPDEVGNEIFSPACTPCLVRMIIEDLRYPLDKPDDKRPLGIALRGCDDKGIIELIKDRRIKREDVMIVGVDCPGTVDWTKAKKLIKDHKLSSDDIVKGRLIWKDRGIALATPSGEIGLEREKILMSKCLDCEGHTPRIYDILIGKEDTKRIPAEPPKEVRELEARSPDEKYEFWDDVFSRCIRCYACRNICTYCHCEECAIDPTTLAIAADSIAADKANRPEWVGRDSTDSSNGFYLITRAYHGTGRCISCEECDRACPMRLPLRLLNRKVRKDAKELFDYDAGKKTEDKSLLSETCDNDPGDFIW